MVDLKQLTAWKWSCLLDFVVVVVVVVVVVLFFILFSRVLRTKTEIVNLVQAAS